VDRAKVNSPSPETVSRILRAAEGSSHHVALVIAATTGLRRGEVLGLRWDAVDLEAGRIRVESTAQAIGQEVEFVKPKTDRSRRTVALPPMTTDVLRRHRAEQAERRLAAGPAWQDFCLVVERGDGAPVHPDVFSRWFARLMDRLGLRVRLHDLRHAYASALLLANVHPKVASEALGHASVSFTMDTYQHLLPSMQETAAQAIQTALGGTGSPSD
jgi:integrase